MTQLTAEQISATVRADMIPARFDISAAQMLHLPEAVLADVQRYADELERPIGWCLWMAWCIASLSNDELAAQLEEMPLAVGTKRAAEVVMPLGTWRHVTRQAERLDRSKSWLLTRAWLLARPQFDDAVAKVH